VASRAWPPAPEAAPEVLAAWHGLFGFTDWFRKVILSDCRLVERAKAVEKGEKVTEGMLDDLAHTNDDYVAYLTAALDGRVAYEASVREKVGL
jgi:hypothetical protein